VAAGGLPRQGVARTCSLQTYTRLATRRVKRITRNEANLINFQVGGASTPGPPIGKQVEGLIVGMAKDNRCWGIIGSPRHC
jgi:hypothetical protein